MMRLQELEEGQAAIEELMGTLDERKDSGLEATFATVARNFHRVFAELVPGGKADLHMLVPQHGSGSTAKYIGVKVRSCGQCCCRPRVCSHTALYCALAAMLIAAVGNFQTFSLLLSARTSYCALGHLCCACFQRSTLETQALKTP